MRTYHPGKTSHTNQHRRAGTAPPRPPRGWLDRSTVPSAVDDVLRSPGEPLAAPLKEEMEGRLGADFSTVRVHTDSAARASAIEVGAHAYTVGPHIVVDPGIADRHTFAHELTHVIQQHNGPVPGTDTGNGLKISNPGDRFEHEADTSARHALSGPSPQRIPRSLPPPPAALGTRAVLQRMRRAVRWDILGRPVDEFNRVLTNDEDELVQKHYVLGKDEDRNYVLPVGGRSKKYMSGVPNLYGGNLDPDETVPRTLNREMGEESNFQYQMSGDPTAWPAATQKVEATRGRQGSQMFMYTARVAKQTPEQASELKKAYPKFQLEMEPEPFRFKASQLKIVENTTDEEIKNQILELFGTLPTRKAGEEFRKAHTIKFLVNQVRKDHSQYHAGLEHARNNPQNWPPSDAHPEFRAAYEEYFEGFLAKKNGKFDSNRRDPAYCAGVKDAG